MYNPRTDGGRGGNRKKRDGAQQCRVWRVGKQTWDEKIARRASLTQREPPHQGERTSMNLKQRQVARERIRKHLLKLPCGVRPSVNVNAFQLFLCELCGLLSCYGDCLLRLSRCIRGKEKQTSRSGSAGFLKKKGCRSLAR